MYDYETDLLIYFEQGKLLHHLDEHVTTKIYGYPDVESYYRDISSAQHLPFIKKTLTLFINSSDDPVVNYIPTSAAEENPWIAMAVTKYGGHIGFLENNFRGRSWADKVTCEFLISVVKEAEKQIELEQN
jgi:predicted alpha/beta-fold hydrolase